MKIFGIEIKKIDDSLFILSSKRIERGDFVVAVSGYPHWTDYPQEVTMTGFDNDDIGVSRAIRVNRKAFKKVLYQFRLVNQTKEKERREEVDRHIRELDQKNDRLLHMINERPRVLLSQTMLDCIVNMLPDPNRAGCGGLTASELSNKASWFTDSLGGVEYRHKVSFVQAIGEGKVEGLTIHISDYNINVTIPLRRENVNYEVYGVSSAIDTYFWDFYAAGIRMISGEAWAMSIEFIRAQNNVMKDFREQGLL